MKLKEKKSNKEHCKAKTLIITKRELHISKKIGKIKEI